MADEHTSTRLGDLLVERGLITRVQLAHAIELQLIRRGHAIKINSPQSYRQGLGEILVELGYINHSQLRSGLTWQKRLRKTTAVMVFIAPLLTAACGGGGGGSSTPTSNNQTGVTRSLSVSTPTDGSGSVSSGDDKKATNNDSKPSSASSIAKSSLRSSASSALPPITTSSSSQSSAATGPTMVGGPVQIYWRPPSRRENGEFLDITELGGYILRYKRDTDSQYKSVVIDDGYIDAYYFENLQGNYDFQLAAFDVNGLQSSFVNVKPR